MIHCSQITRVFTAMKELLLPYSHIGFRKEGYTKGSSLRDFMHAVNYLSTKGPSLRDFVCAVHYLSTKGSSRWDLDTIQLKGLSRI